MPKEKVVEEKQTLFHVRCRLRKSDKMFVASGKLACGHSLKAQNPTKEGAMDSLQYQAATVEAYKDFKRAKVNEARRNKRAASKGG